MHASDATTTLVIAAIGLVIGSFGGLSVAQESALTQFQAEWAKLGSSQESLISRLVHPDHDNLLRGRVYKLVQAALGDQVASFDEFLSRLDRLGHELPQNGWMRRQSIQILTGVLKGESLNQSNSTLQVRAAPGLLSLFHKDFLKGPAIDMSQLPYHRTQVIEDAAGRIVGVGVFHLSARHDAQPAWFGVAQRAQYGPQAILIFETWLNSLAPVHKSHSSVPPILRTFVFDRSVLKVVGDHLAVLLSQPVKDYSDLVTLRVSDTQQRFRNGDSSVINPVLRIVRAMVGLPEQGRLLLLAQLENARSSWTAEPGVFFELFWKFGPDAVIGERVQALVEAAFKSDASIRKILTEAIVLEVARLEGIRLSGRDLYYEHASIVREFESKNLNADERFLALRRTLETGGPEARLGILEILLRASRRPSTDLVLKVLDLMKKPLPDQSDSNLGSLIQERALTFLQRNVGFLTDGIKAQIETAIADRTLGDLAMKVAPKLSFAVCAANLLPRLGR